MREEFRPIPGWEGRYEVSNLGRVRSLNYRAPGKVGYLRPMWSQVTPKKNRRYASVRLQDRAAGRDRRLSVHRLVALAFIPNPDGKPQVNHIDLDTTNNVVENLEWATSQENRRHALANGVASRPLDSGKRYRWEHRDGRTEWASPDTMARRYALNRADAAKMTNPTKYPDRKTAKGWRVVNALELRQEEASCA